MKRNFSLTQLLIVVLLIVILYLGGRMVAPPPAAPPKEENQVTNLPSAPAKPPKQALVPLPAGMDKKLLKHGIAKKTVDQWKKKGIPEPMLSELYEMVNHPDKPKSSLPNPYTIDVSDKYWHQAQMGEAGIKQQRAIFHKEMEELKAATMNPQPPSAAK
jgi:hypothetical protein